MLIPPNPPALDPIDALPLAETHVLGAPALALASLLVLPLALALYRRISRARVFDCAARRRVYDAIAGRPGRTLGEVAREVGLDYKSVEHHARVLLDLCLVESVRDGRFIRYFASGRLTLSEREYALLSSAPARRAVYDSVWSGARTRGEVARETGLSRSSVRWHVDRLAALGWVAIVERPRAPARLLARESPRLVPSTPEPARSPEGIAARDGEAARPRVDIENGESESPRPFANIAEG